MDPQDNTSPFDDNAEEEAWIAQFNQTFPGEDEFGFEAEDEDGIFFDFEPDDVDELD